MNSDSSMGRQFLSKLGIVIWYGCSVVKGNGWEAVGHMSSQAGVSNCSVSLWKNIAFIASGWIMHTCIDFAEKLTTYFFETFDWLKDCSRVFIFEECARLLEFCANFDPFFKMFLWGGNCIISHIYIYIHVKRNFVTYFS